jgi:hypothetical protein
MNTSQESKRREQKEKKRTNINKNCTVMKKIYLIFAALTSVTLFSCTGDELIETPPPVTNPEVEKPIVFSSLSKTFTRADYTGKDAATLLGNQFVVSGYKGPQSLWNTTSNQIVFDNYAVKYKENTAHTTESNVANWEYVGVDRTPPAITNGITRQNVKYWDYYSPQYDFIAWSTGTKTAIYEVPSSGIIPSGSVLVTGITPNSASSGAYELSGKATDLAECYIADLVTVKKSAYDQPVMIKFRKLSTKLRIGIYETVPGYSVKDVKFYTKGTALDKDTDDPSKPAAGQIISDGTIFTAGYDIFTEGSYIVKYPTVDTPTDPDNNQAHVEFQPKWGVNQNTYTSFGGLNYTTKEDGEKKGTLFLGRSSDKATFAGDASNNYYMIVLPNETGANLNLRVDFTLEATDGSGEEIHVKNARAQVPSIYSQWKAGYAYTYLFKISDKTNGRTGVYDPLLDDDNTYNSDPAGLYPITFDAVVINADDTDGKEQETITTVSTPSITTYQQNSTVVNADEYTVNGKDIFVTVNEDDNLVTLTGKAALYLIPEGKTEADVIDAMQIRDDYPAEGTIKGRSGLVLTEATKVNAVADLAANKYMLTNSVEFGADGNAISVGTNQALRFTPKAPESPSTVNTYAFVYTKAAPTTTYDKFEEVTKTAGADVTNLYRNFNLTAVTGDAKASWTYMSKNASGVLSIETAFAGQYLNGSGSSIYTITGGSGTTEDPYVYSAATSYAVTGTTYYYKVGSDYIVAHNVNYADFATATDLFTFDGADYTAKTDAAPVPGTAYYQRTGEGTTESPYVYTYCILLPQQVDGWYRYQFDYYGRYACMSGEKALGGHGYFDKYIMNDGEYYTKVIKVQ